MSSNFLAESELENAQRCRVQGKKNDQVTTAAVPRKALARIENRQTTSTLHRPELAGGDLFKRNVLKVPLQQQQQQQRPVAQLEIFQDNETTTTTTGSTTITPDHTMPRQCHGAFGCWKEVSSKCAYVCCGDCCRRGLGDGNGKQGLCQFHRGNNNETNNNNFSSSSIVLEQHSPNMFSKDIPTPNDQTSKDRVAASSTSLSSKHRAPPNYSASSCCQGTLGCWKKVSKKCPFGYCGDCCRERVSNVNGGSEKDICAFHDWKQSKAMHKQTKETAMIAMSTTTSVLECQGADECDKLVSKRCIYGCCGDCCRLNLGMAAAAQNTECSFHVRKCAKAKNAAAKKKLVATIPANVDESEEVAMAAAEILTALSATPAIAEEKEDSVVAAHVSKTFPVAPSVLEEGNESDSSDEEGRTHAFAYLPKTLTINVMFNKSYKRDVTREDISATMCDEDDTPLQKTGDKEEAMVMCDEKIEKFVHVMGDDEVSIITCDRDIENSVRVAADEEVSIIMCDEEIEHSAQVAEDEEMSIIMCDEQNDDSQVQDNHKTISSVFSCEEVLADALLCRVLPDETEKAIVVDDQDTLSIIMSEETVAGSRSCGDTLLSLSNTKGSTKDVTPDTSKSLMSRFRDRAKQMSLARKLSSVPTVTA